MFDTDLSNNKGLKGFLLFDTAGGILDTIASTIQSLVLGNFNVGEMLNGFDLGA